MRSRDGVLGDSPCRSCVQWNAIAGQDQAKRLHAACLSNQLARDARQSKAAATHTT